MIPEEYVKEIGEKFPGFSNLVDLMFDDLILFLHSCISSDDYSSFTKYPDLLNHLKEEPEGEGLQSLIPSQGYQYLSDFFKILSEEEWFLEYWENEDSIDEEDLI
jgi:hypothetical protein